MIVGELEGYRDVCLCTLVGFSDEAGGITLGELTGAISIVSVGILLGICVGRSLCVLEGKDVGTSVSSSVSGAELLIVGNCDGVVLGVSVSTLLEICVVTTRLGCWEGNEEGKYVGLSVGIAELLILGDCDGSSLGASVGVLLGVCVGNSLCVAISGIGWLEGIGVGNLFDVCVGIAELLMLGDCDGALLSICSLVKVGVCVGNPLCAVMTRLGCLEDSAVGSLNPSDGVVEGGCDAPSLGASVGELLGILVGNSYCVITTRLGC